VLGVAVALARVVVAVAATLPASVGRTEREEGGLEVEFWAESFWAVKKD
jgi:hypothetical protein